MRAEVIKSKRHCTWFCKAVQNDECTIGAIIQCAGLRIQ
jgi:hypothetical protein